MFGGKLMDTFMEKIIKIMIISKIANSNFFLISTMLMKNKHIVTYGKKARSFGNNNFHCDSYVHTLL